MNTGWQVVDCSQLEGEVGYVRGRIVVRPKEGHATYISLAQVAVVLVGVKSSLSGAILGKLQEYQVACLIVDWKAEPIAALYPFSEHTRVGARQIAQASLSKPRRKAAWAEIVRAKVWGQSCSIRKCSRITCDRLRKLSKSIRSGDPDNVEATAARLYWAQFPGGTGFKRMPNNSDGVIGMNSCLDYAYTVLRGHGIRAVGAAGLAGTLGIFHRGRSNPFNLVDDLIEPFRPAIDEQLITSLSSWDVSDPEVKRVLVETTTSVFDSQLGKIIPTVLTEFAQAYGRYVEGDELHLKVPRWQG